MARATIRNRRAQHSLSSLWCGAEWLGGHMAVVVGRDEELGVVESFVGEIGGGPIALVLAGEAGIGKTVVWEAGVTGLSGASAVC